MADLIGKYISNTNGGIDQSSKETTIPSITFFTVEGCPYLLYNNSITWDSPGALDTSYIPDPILCCQQNTQLTFYCSNSFSAHVNYGDGYEEDIEATRVTDGYCLGWRSLDIEYEKSPSSSNGGWDVGGALYGGGGYFVPRSNYKFKDGSGIHKVIITFSREVTKLYSAYNQFSEFPIIQLTELRELTLINSRCSNINWKRIQGMKNLTNLSIRSIVNYRFTAFPDELFQMTNLTNLSMEDFGKFDSDEAIEASNIRNFKILTKLRNLNLYGNGIYKYIKEFNELKQLRTFNLGSNIGNPIKTPDFSEVEKIELPNLSSFSFMQRYGDGTNNDPNDNRKWGEEINGKLTDGVSSSLSLTGIWTNCSTGITEFPKYLQNSRIKAYNFTKSMQTVERVNKFVDLVYNATIKGTMNSSNPMWGKRYNLYTSAQPWSKRPSGKNQAPSGFVKGSSNGNPQSQMEKVYVLVNNYSCTFNVAPETSTNSLTSRISTLSEEDLNYCIIPEFSAYNIYPGELFLFHNTIDNDYWISQTRDNWICPEEVIDIKFNNIEELEEYIKSNNLQNLGIIESWESQRKDELESAINLAEQNKDKIKEVAKKLKNF